MNSKKLFLPAIILAVAILAMAACCFAISIAKKPAVTEQDFTFSITYELNGETVRIDGVYAASYLYNGGYADSKERVYTGEIVGEENSFEYVLKEWSNGRRIVLETNLEPGYLMGDPEHDYFTDEPFEPHIWYYDETESAYDDEETLQELGVKLVSWEYPAPIENTFVFSHLSILSGEVVFPVLLVGLTTLIAVLIFVKKEKGLERSPIDQISVLFNFLIGFIAVPFFAVVSWFSDISGDNSHPVHQMFYFTSAVAILCIAASVCLRRKGFRMSGLLVQFAGPAYFILIVLLASFGLF